MAHCAIPNKNLPGEPYSIRWKATPGPTTEYDLYKDEPANARVPTEFYALQVGYFTPGSSVVVACVYNGDGLDTDESLLINPVFFYAPGQIVVCRGIRIATSGKDRSGTSYTTTSSIDFICLSGLSSQNNFIF